ncbi:MAG: hypothetical protein EHM77_09410 [Planctomycetaceae bacterium]|nr:MAG: hypothetical protein EHM77_09410 [Planctomycetaceae bacterium]
MVTLQIMLKAFDLQTVYGTSTYQTENFDLIKAVDPMTLDNAKIYCANQRATLFNAYPDMKIQEIMNFFKTDEIWTNLFKSKSGFFKDNDQFSPVMTVLDANIENTDLLGVFSENSGIVLERTPGLGNYSIGYKRKEKSDLKTVICMQKTSKPKEKYFRDRMITVKGIWLNRIGKKVDFLKQQQQSVEKKLLLLPKLTNSTNVVTEYIRTPQRVIEFELEHELPIPRNDIIEQLGDVKDRLDLVIIGSQITYLLEQTEELLGLAMKPMTDMTFYLDIKHRELLMRGYMPKLFIKNTDELVISIGPEFYKIEGQNYVNNFFSPDFFKLTAMDVVFVLYLWISFIYFLARCIKYCCISKTKKRRYSDRNLPRVRKITQINLPKCSTHANEVRMYETETARQYNRSRTKKLTKERSYRLPLHEMDSELSLYKKY